MNELSMKLHEIDYEFIPNTPRNDPDTITNFVQDAYDYVAENTEDVPYTAMITQHLTHLYLDVLAERIILDMDVHNDEQDPFEGPMHAAVRYEWEGSEYQKMGDTDGFLKYFGENIEAGFMFSISSPDFERFAADIVKIMRRQRLHFHHLRYPMSYSFSMRRHGMRDYVEDIDDCQVNQPVKGVW